MVAFSWCLDLGCDNIFPFQPFHLSTAVHIPPIFFRSFLIFLTWSRFYHSDQFPAMRRPHVLPFPVWLEYLYFYNSSHIHCYCRVQTFRLSFHDNQRSPGVTWWQLVMRVSNTATHCPVTLREAWSMKVARTWRGGRTDHTRTTGHGKIQSWSGSSHWSEH